MFILHQEILECVKQIGRIGLQAVFVLMLCFGKKRKKKQAWATVEGNFVAQDLLKKKSENMQRYKGS